MKLYPWQKLILALIKNKSKVIFKQNQSGKSELVKLVLEQIKNKKA